MMKVKNRYPTNTARNDYFRNRKQSTIETPLWLAHYIKDILDEAGVDFKYVIDVGCHKGNLSYPYRKSKRCIGFDNKIVRYHSKFRREDFLEYGFDFVYDETCLVVCNPPFNDKDGDYGRALLPELFLKKIFETFTPNIKLILFAPMGLLKNQRLISKRYHWIRDCGAQITSELELPIDIYGQGIQVHSSVLFFNMFELKPRYFIPDLSFGL